MLAECRKQDPMARPRRRVSISSVGLGLFSLLLSGLVAAPANAAPPTHDDPGGAIVIPAGNYTDTTNTTEATANAATDYCGVATVWYQFTPEYNGNYRFDTEGSDFDTTIALHSGPGGSPYLCNDFDYTTGSPQAATVFFLSAGMTYYVEVGSCCLPATEGQVGPGGNLVLSVEVPPAQIVEITLNEIILSSTPGVVTLTGSVTCAVPGVFVTYGTLTQKQGLNVASAGFYQYQGECHQTPREWSVVVTAQTRAFTSSPVTVTATAQAFTEFYTFDEHTVTQRVKVKRR